MAVIAIARTVAITVTAHLQPARLRLNCGSQHASAGPAKKPHNCDSGRALSKTAAKHGPQVLRRFGAGNRGMARISIATMMVSVVSHTEDVSVPALAARHPPLLARSTPMRVWRDPIR